MFNFDFSFENNFNFSYLVYKVKNEDKIDTVEHNMITGNKIDGLLDVACSSIDDERFYKYDISSKIPLKRFINSCYEKDTIIKILSNTLKMFVDIEDYMILKEHVVLDENYVFVDVSNTNLYFVCLPVANSKNKLYLNEFVNKIINNFNPEDLENKSLLFLLKNILDKDELVDIKQALNIIKSIDCNKNVIKRENKCADEEKKLEAASDILNNTQERNIKKLYDKEIAIEKNEKHLDFLVPGQKDKNEKKDKKNKVEIEKINHKDKNKLKSFFKNTKPDKKKAVVEKALENTDDKAEFNHTVLISNSNEETSLLNVLTSGLYPIQPYLIRKQNNERINISSDLFRIGKEINYADYAIKDNNTISRAHADIIKINKDYYIQDNNSKNHTYVNNNMVCDGQAVKLEHNYEIMLSDERFIFKLY